MIKVVLFDFHNTLATCDGWLELEIKTLPALTLRKLHDWGAVDTSGHSGDEATRLFRDVRQGVRESGVELSAFEGTRRVLQQMGIEVPDATLMAAIEELQAALLPAVEVVPGAGEALEKLRDQGYLLGVVSSAGYPPFVEMALETLGLRSYFSEVVTSAGEGIYKSNPEIFRLAAAKLGAEPAEAVHVGDHPVYDVQSARAAGLRAIWLSAESHRTASLHGAAWDELAGSGAEADAIVTRMEDVPAAVARFRVG